MIYDLSREHKRVLPAVRVHARERLTKDFNGIKSEGVCAWWKQKIVVSYYGALAFVSLTSKPLENHKTTRNQDRLHESRILENRFNIRHDRLEGVFHGKPVVT